MKNILIIALLVFVMPISAQVVDPGKYEIKNVSINTKYSDFGTAFFGRDKVIFASPKEATVITKTTWEGNNQAFLDLFIADINEEKRGELEKKRKVLGDVNSRFHEGNVTFTKDLKTVYFDANNINDKGKAVKDSTGIVNIQLYKADVLESGEWKNIVKLAFNNDQFSTGHPSLSVDGKKLYFISDRPGTIGKTDIFVVDVFEDGTFGYPKNMGAKINTPEREMFPFISDDNFLYFSSDGHKGYGELDVFASKIFDNTVSEAINLEEPINSKKDDFAYIIDDTNHKGYFSSNREGGKGDDDIYFLVADPPIQIEGKQVISGIVKDADSGQIVPGSSISLLDENGNVIAEETIPTELGNWEPFKNEIKDLKVSVIKGDISKIVVKRFVDNENPNLGDEVEFTVEFTNIGGRTVSGVHVADILPKGYVYVRDDSPQLYDSKKDEIYIDKIQKKGIKTIKVKAKVLPIEKGVFSFDAVSNKNYKIVARSPGYLEGEINVKTDNDTDVSPLEVKIKMDPELRVVDDKIMVNINTIYFDFDKWNIRKDAAKELDKVVAVMKEHPSIIIEAGSHTDSRATEAYNQTLSEKRAKATMKYIVSKGISRDRIRAKGYGEMQLVNNCSSFVKCTRQQHQLNRRTEFVIVNDDERLTSTNATIKNVLIDKENNKTYVNLNNDVKQVDTDEFKRNITKDKVVDTSSTDNFLKDKFIKINPIYYAYDSWSLSNKEKQHLNYIINLMKFNQQIVIDVQVHTDAINSDNHNNLLSAKRAKAIINYMTNKGISDNRISGKGYGEYVLTNKCKSFTKCSDAEHQANRRVEFVIVSGNRVPKETFIEKDGEKFINTNPIYFNYEKFNIRKDAAYELDRVARILKENPNLKIEVGSHTDANNTSDYNQKLSDHRAQSVKKYLISKGVEASRIKSKGYGETQLINECVNVKCTPEQHQENRRTEFKIIE